MNFTRLLSHPLVVAGLQAGAIATENMRKEDERQKQFAEQLAMRTYDYRLQHLDDDAKAQQQRRMFAQQQIAAASPGFERQAALNANKVDLTPEAAAAYASLPPTEIAAQKEKEAAQKEKEARDRDTAIQAELRAQFDKEVARWEDFSKDMSKTGIANAISGLKTVKNMPQYAPFATELDGKITALQGLKAVPDPQTEADKQQKQEVSDAQALVILTDATKDDQQKLVALAPLMPKSSKWIQDQYSKLFQLYYVRRPNQGPETPSPFPEAVAPEKLQQMASSAFFGIKNIGLPPDLERKVFNSVSQASARLSLDQQKALASYGITSPALAATSPMGRLGVGGTPPSSVLPSAVAKDVNISLPPPVEQRNTTGLTPEEINAVQAVADSLGKSFNETRMVWDRNRERAAAAPVSDQQLMRFVNNPASINEETGVPYKTLEELKDVLARRKTKGLR